MDRVRRPLDKAGEERGGVVAYQLRSPIPTDEQDGFLNWYVIRVSCIFGTMSKVYRWPWDSSKSYHCGLSNCSP